jgi:hypothetical protein
MVQITPRQKLGGFMTSNQVDAVNKCNSRILYLLSRDGFNADQTNIKQIQMVRDYVLFSGVAY